MHPTNIVNTPAPSTSVSEPTAATLGADSPSTDAVTAPSPSTTAPESPSATLLADLPSSTSAPESGPATLLADSSSTPSAPATRPAISVIIPAFNEAGRLGATLDRLLEHPILGRCRRETDGPATVELIVVDDGSTDGTAEISERHLTGHPLARTIVSPDNRGKGHAIRLGARHATGDLILFMDADLATSLDAVAPMLARLATADVVIGSREMRGAIVTGRSRGRSAMHRAFSAQARGLTRVGVSDPQCGFKGFRREAAIKLFSRSLVNGYTFDVEVLLIARKMGLTIAEIPVTWHAMGGSKIRPLRDPLSMAADMARVRYRHRGRRGDVLEVVPEPVAA